MKKVSVFFADGCEEVEALTVVDLLRRAGVETDMVSIMGKLLVTSSHGVGIQTDHLFEETDFEETDMLVLPGGMPGTLHLRAHEGLAQLLKTYDVAGKQGQDKYVAAICAAPSVLGGLGILEGKLACCYPGFEEKLTGATVTMEPAIQDGYVITGRGMGTAIPFGLKLIQVLCGVEKAEEVKKGILFE